MRVMCISVGGVYALARLCELGASFRGESRCIRDENHRVWGRSQIVTDFYS